MTITISVGDIEEIYDSDKENTESDTRTKKSNKEKFDLSFNDCTCPICFEILIEPVLMPCKHELCLECFDQIKDLLNLECPICRVEIGKFTNSRSLINWDRWKKIETKFSKEIKLRRDGRTAQLVAESIANYNNFGIVDDTYKSIVIESCPKRQYDLLSTSVDSDSYNEPSPFEEKCKYDTTGQEKEKSQAKQSEEEGPNEYLIEFLRKEKEEEERQSLLAIQMLLEQEDNISYEAYVNLLKREQEVKSPSPVVRSKKATKTPPKPRTTPKRLKSTSTTTPASNEKSTSRKSVSRSSTKSPAMNRESSSSVIEIAPLSGPLFDSSDAVLNDSITTEKKEISNKRTYEAVSSSSSNTSVVRTSSSNTLVDLSNCGVDFPVKKKHRALP
jgi:hypothetical protein